MKYRERPRCRNVILLYCRVNKVTLQDFLKDHLTYYEYGKQMFSLRSLRIQAKKMLQEQKS